MNAQKHYYIKFFLIKIAKKYFSNFAIIKYIRVSLENKNGEVQKQFACLIENRDYKSMTKFNMITQ